jgi:hypothetical protein
MGSLFCSIPKTQIPAVPAAKYFSVWPLVVCWSSEKIGRSAVSKIFARTPVRREINLASL